MGYYFLGVQQTDKGMGYEVLDTSDGSIDLLSSAELSQAQTIGLDINRAYHEASGTKHIAVKLVGTDVGVLFRVRDKRVTILPFDTIGFYHLSKSSNILEFTLEDGIQVSIFAYFYDSRFYLLIRNRLRDLNQYRLYYLDSSDHTYTDVQRTPHVESETDRHGMALKRRLERIRKAVKDNNGHVSSCCPVALNILSSK